MCDWNASILLKLYFLANPHAHNCTTLLVLKLLSYYLLAFAVVGGVVFMAAMAGIICCILYKRRKNKGKISITIEVLYSLEWLFFFVCLFIFFRKSLEPNSKLLLKKVRKIMFLCAINCEAQIPMSHWKDREKGLANFLVCAESTYYVTITCLTWSRGSLPLLTVALQSRRTILVWSDYRQIL